MLVTFREHAAPDLCIFHKPVTLGFEARDACGFRASSGISSAFTARYEFPAALWYLKC